MKNKKINVTLIMRIILIIAVIAFIIVYNFIGKEEKLVEIPQDYIAVFNGGSGERTNSTYVNKLNNGLDNHGYKYINTTNTTKSWGSSEWNVEITSQGELTWQEEVFTIAEKNNAYSYVKIPNDDNTYSIDEFKTMFIKEEQ